MKEETWNLYGTQTRKENRKQYKDIKIKQTKNLAQTHKKYFYDDIIIIISSSSSSSSSNNINI